MADFETDYLIIGAGAVGLAFADTLLDEDPDCHITIVDKHARPGGHWNDAYPFVALHQPSATYGVNSREMCPDRVDEHGHNAGMYPLAKHAEILSYYSKLMSERMIPSGRVSYHPLTEYHGREGSQHTVKGILSGENQVIEVRRKLVDGTFFKTSVPSTHTPAYEIAESARFAIPGDLPGLWKDIGNLPENYIVIGGGKTAMDTAVWLLEAGVSPDKIGWVRPRDSWMFNRKLLQPAKHGIEGLIEFQSDLVEAAAASETGDEMFAELGKRGTMLRIDESVTPKMFHFAVMSEAEVDLLRSIKTVYRQGRVSKIEDGAMHFGDEAVEVPANTLFIDCTASAVPFEARDKTRKFFDGDTITLQLVQAPFVPYSAALGAFLEANFETDDERNALCPPAPLTDTTDTYPYAVMANLMSTAILSNNEKTNAFNARSRLHPTGPAVAEMIANNDPRLAELSKVGPKIQANMPGVIKLGMAAKAIHEAT
ncbi:NAD(P)-binding protein [Erythrobacter sp. F6033]|uniref:NAD(P)-binding protein n=1 Tax=Erythrobacter sp. F6033 TaxID=2926401 RepID=UPI001FF22E96|nr:NAD(P)-binding protein [Erythrobacter sp. F6033]MCK0127294.1 NAD(P)-binding protein [Erythrobacter sp. F6033]